jgi:hypothetical protein
MHTTKTPMRIRSILLAIGLSLVVNFAISEVVESSRSSSQISVESGGVELPKPPRP